MRTASTKPRWTTRQLGEIASIERDAVPPATIASGADRTTYVGLEHITSDGAFLNVQTVANGELASMKFRFTEKHILYGKLRPYLSKIAIPQFSGVCSTDILPILPGKDVDRSYLCHFLRQPRMIDLANSRTAGANLPRLSAAQLASFDVPLPPLAEQKRIADILDKADDVRRKRRETHRALAALPHAIFLDAFGHPEANPNRWPVLPFVDVCDSRLGKMLDAKQQSGEHRRPYMRNLNVQWGRLDMSSILEMDFDADDRKLFRLQYGDVLICEGGAGVGQTAVWRDELPECYFQKSLHRVRPYSDKATPEYIAYWIWTMMKGSSLLGSISSATIPHLTGIKLKQVPVPVPPIGLQRQFQRRIFEYGRIAGMAERASNETHALFHSVLQRGFRGDL